MTIKWEQQSTIRGLLKVSTFAIGVCFIYFMKSSNPVADLLLLYQGISGMHDIIRDETDVTG